MRYLPTLILPPLLIFGLYHLLLWFDLFGMRDRVFWRRVGWSSACAHVLFTAGAFVLTWIDYRSTDRLFGAVSLDVFIMNSNEFWQVLFLFDTLSAVALLGLLAILDAAGVGSVPMATLTAGVVLSIGTFQWYWVGGVVGALLERVWSGLKTQDDDGPDWL